MKERARRKGVLLLGAFFVLFKGELFASQGAKASSERVLEEVVVTASRIEEPRSEVSSFVQVIPQERIELSSAQDLGDLFTQSGLGHVHKYPGFLTSRVAIRGLATDLFDQQKSRVLVLMDGVKAGTVNFAKIFLDDVERVEVLKGPASVLYGSQAMGGVINVITKRAKKEGFSGTLGFEAGSWDYYKGKAELLGKKGPVDFYLLATRSAQNDYDAKGYGRIKNTSWDAESLSAKLGFEPKRGHDLLLSLQYVKGWKIGSPGARYSPSLTDYSDKGKLSYALEYSNNYLKGKVFYVKDEDEWHYPVSRDFTKKDTKTKGISLIGNYTLWRGIKFIGGVDYNEIEVSSKRLLGAPYYPNSEYETYGVFGEGRLSLLEERLLLNLGARYDYFEDKIKATPGLKVNPRSVDFDRVTLRGGAVFRLNRDLSLKANLGTGFRAPAPDELAADFVSSWGTRYLGNPDLKPEKSKTLDFGLELRKSPLKLDFAYFMTDFKDKIISLYDSSLKAMTYKNVDGAEIQGFELNFALELGALFRLPFSLEPYADLTYHTKFVSKDPKEVSSYGSTLLYTPKWTGTFGLRGGSERLLFDLQAVYVGDEKVQDWDQKSPTYGKGVPKSDFTIFNLGVILRPHKHLEGTLKIENLFNRAYEYVRSYPMPERTLRAGLSFKF